MELGASGRSARDPRGGERRHGRQISKFARLRRENRHGESQRPSVLDDVPIESVLCVSYFGFEMHELDFGEALGGEIEAFRPPSRGILIGMPVVFPRLPERICEFVLNEQEEVVDFFAEDEIVRRFASK